MRVARRKGELVRLWVDQPGAAMSSLQTPRNFQHREVAADGGNRRIHLRRQLIQRCEFHLLEVFLDSLLALFSLHLKRSVIDFDRYCKKPFDNSSRKRQIHRKSCPPCHPHRTVPSSSTSSVRPCIRGS